MMAAANARDLAALLELRARGPRRRHDPMAEGGQPMNDELRALTVRQPWAACIASGRKLVENRTWPTKYRGPLAIHAASTRDGFVFDHPRFVQEAYGLAPSPSRVLSAVVAVVELTGCHEYTPGCCDTSWAERGAGTWHWTLANVRALSEPVECAGRLSVWRPAPETVAAVLAQIGVSA